MTTFSNSGTNFDKLNTVGTLPRALPETSISKEQRSCEFFRIKNLLVESTCSEVYGALSTSRKKAPAVERAHHSSSGRC